MEVPHGIRSDTKRGSNGRLVVKDALVKFIGLAGVVEDETLVILGATVHDRLKHWECRNDTEEGFPEAFSVLADVLSETEDVVDICTEARWKIHTVLCSHHEEDLPVAAVHKELTYSVLAQE